MSTTAHDTTGNEDVGVERAEEFAREHPAVVKFARVGWIAKGVVYALTGILALLIGVRASDGSTSDGGSDQEASQTGAIARIAENPAGVAVLWVVAIGLVTYSLWRIASVLLPADNDLKGWLTRGGYLVSAVTYLLLAWTAVTFARQPSKSGESSEDSKVESFTRDFMTNSAGRALIFVIGAILIVIAAVFLWKAISASFESQLMPGSVGPVSHQMLVVLGRIGWVGRAAMMSLIGFFLARSAIRFDPDDAQGLDGSLRKAASSGLGTWLVVAVGAGLLLYGIFCALSAPKRRLVGADS
ncbi:DUF1206 domain-containing protein [Ilumatobacter nonamiensis]|uniref:DUF1206 domain-containing protein n=1 Tax=Ilumatobacter nonamiensis TaxID=467093 RepID=UPI00058C8689|nr:DUF1206 domain-containing protein [Ilumatobacter nonamiensis]